MSDQKTEETISLTGPVAGLAVSNARSENKGTAVYVWRRGKTRYDEVSWVPEKLSVEEAFDRAELLIQSDGQIQRIQIEICGEIVADTARK